MKQERLSFDSESDLERLLLRAGRRGAPPGAKKRAILAASGAAAASTLAAAEGTAAVAKVGSIAAVKWIGVLCLTGAGAVAGAAGLRSAAHDLSRRTVTTTAAATARLTPKTARPPRADSSWIDPPPAPPPPTATVDPAPVEPVALIPRAAPVESTVFAHGARPAPRSADRSKPLASPIPIELSALDDAKAAIEAGSPERALSLLDAYRARFPRGEMQPEATMLRIEALCRTGRRDDAERSARAFLAGDSAGPYAKRLQSLLSATNP